MLKSWQGIPIPVAVDEDPTLEEKMEACMKKHVRERHFSAKCSVFVLHVTEQNPLPTKDIQFALRYIECNLFRVNVYFAVVAENGYLMEFHLDDKLSATRIVDYHQTWTYTDLDHAELLTALEKLTSPIAAADTTYRDDVRAYKQRHQELDFAELKISMHNFRSAFPVVRNDSTPEPVLDYRLTGNLTYERIGHFYSNYQHYYDKLVEFYVTPTTITNYALKAKKIHLAFDTHRGERDSTFVKGVLQEESFAQQVYFAAYVVVQFAFCAPPPSAWDAEDAILDAL